MKHHVINRDKIIEAYIVDPESEQTGTGMVRRGYRVRLNLDVAGSVVTRTTRDLSEAQCHALIESLGLFKWDI